MVFFKRDNKHQKNKMQLLNKDWWESNPMSYDWEKKNNFEKFSLKWFDYIDGNFIRDSKIYHNIDSQIPFDQFINYNSIIGNDVLEIGCGYGFHAEMILKNSKPKNYIAVDITTEAIEATKKRLELKKLNMENVKLINADAENLPIKDDSQDLIWSWGVIHHSLNTEKIISEIYRTLKKNGKFKIMIYNKNSFRYYALGIFRGIFNLKFLKKNLQEINMEYTDGYYARHFTQKEVKKLLNQSNLKITKITNLQDSLLVPLPGARILCKLKIFKNISDLIMKKYGWFLYFEGEK